MGTQICHGQGWFGPAREHEMEPGGACSMNQRTLARAGSLVIRW